MTKIIAVVIFAITYIGIASEKAPRHVVGLLGALLLMFTGVLDLNKAITYVNWDTIGLLLGMFVLMAVLADAGFFQYLSARVAAMIHYNPSRVIIIFPIMAGVLAAFMDSITVVLFLSALSLDLCKLLKLDPVPLVIAEVCAANIGGAATLVGDPPNVILGTMLGFTFTDFAHGTGPFALMSLLLTVGYFRLLTRKEYGNRNVVVKGVDPEYMITDRRLFFLGLGGLISAVGLLISYRYIDLRLGTKISPAVASLLPALVVLFVGGEATREAFDKIDGESLLFFISLFMVIGGLEETGVVSSIGSVLGAMVGRNKGILVATLTWASGLLSGIVDNVPLALTMGYLIKYLAGREGAGLLPLLTWSVALGVDLGGNLTPIGASANVVGYSALERRGAKVGWKRWLVLAVPPTLLSLALSSLILALR